MAVFRLAPEESPDPTQQHPPPQQQLQAGREVASDDERSVAADSWSIKSDYGSTLDDEQRHADAAEALSSAANFRAALNYRFFSFSNSICLSFFSQFSIECLTKF